MAAALITAFLNAKVRDLKFAVVAIQEAQGLPYNPTLEGIMPILKTPLYLAIVIGVMIASHFILWNWKKARTFWHRRLAGARLRGTAA